MVVKLCKCGHNHISFVGDLGENHDQEGEARIDECEKCDCEKFVEAIDQEEFDKSIPRKRVKRKKGRTRFYTFSTRLKYTERNELLTRCKIMYTTPSEFLREILLEKLKRFRN